MDLQVSGDTLSTDGIDMTVESFNFNDSCSLKDKAPISFSVWDFGGQEVYHTTHSLFLSDRSIFLIVYKLTKEDYDSKISYWLNFIKSKAPNSPIILVGTHLDSLLTSSGSKKSRLSEITETTTNKFKETYKKKFKQLQHPVRPVSTHTLKGMEELIKHIQDVAMEQPFTKTLPPERWFALDHLLTIKRESFTKEQRPPVLTWEEYLGYAKAAGVGKGRDDEVDRVTEYLHEIGTIFVVPRESSCGQLVKDVFIDPQWMSSVFKSVLTTKHGFLKAGVMSLNMVESQLWREFPESIHSVLLNVLETFEICFTMPGSEGETLICIPSLLPTQKPEEILTDFPQRDETCSNFKREYVFDFVPAGLFSRYVAKLMRYGDGLHWWRHGVMIKSKTKEAWGLIELKPNLNLISILLRGKEECSDSFCHLVELLDFLLIHWFKLNAKVQYYDALSNTSYTNDFIESQAMIGNWNLVNPNGVKVSMDRVAPDLCLSNLQHLRIDIDTEITLGDALGEGSFATVYSGKLEQEVVAVKRLTMPSDDEEMECKKVFSEFRKELKTMGSVQHANIVNLIGYSLKRPYSMVLEYVPHGSLYDYVRQHELSWPMRLRIGYDIAVAMYQLHTCKPPIIHQDLKTPNVLIAGLNPIDTVVAKVADFGTSSKLYGTQFKGTKARDRDVVNPTWLAPEIIREEPYTAAADIYPYGIMLWELITGEHPFDEFNYEFSLDLESAVMEGKRPTIPQDCPSEFAELIKRCWHNDPGKRPSFADIVNVLLPEVIKEMAPPLLEILDRVKNEQSLLMEKQTDAIKRREKTRLMMSRRYSDKQLEQKMFQQTIQQMGSKARAPHEGSGLDLLASVQNFKDTMGTRMSMQTTSDDILNITQESNDRLVLAERSFDHLWNEVLEIYTKFTDNELLLFCQMRAIPVAPNTPRSKLIEILHKDDSQTFQQRKLYGFHRIADLIDDTEMVGLTHQEIKEREMLQKTQEKEVRDLSRRHQVQRAEVTHKHETMKQKRESDAIRIEVEKRKEEFARMEEDMRKSEIARNIELKRLHDEKLRLDAQLNLQQQQRDKNREQLIRPDPTKKLERQPSINPKETPKEHIVLKAPTPPIPNPKVSPKVFAPLKYGNVRTGTVESLKSQYEDMQKRNTSNSLSTSPSSPTFMPRRGTSPSHSLIYPANYPRPVPGQKDDDPLIETEIRGKWSESDDTLGGSPNTATWTKNPQYVLKVLNGGATLNIVLTQDPLESNPSIAIYLLKCYDGLRQLDIKEKVYAPDHFVNKRSIEAKCNIPEGLFVIMCATYETTKENSFTLKVSGHNFELQDVKEWELQSFKTKWSPQLCGGCMNYPTWKKNPQFKLNITEKTRCTFTLTPERDNIGCGFYICFLDYKVKTKSSFTMISAVLDVVLTPGEYFVVVSTFAQGIQCDVKFSCYSDKKVALEMIEG